MTISKAKFIPVCIVQIAGTSEFDGFLGMLYGAVRKRTDMLDSLFICVGVGKVESAESAYVAETVEKSAAGYCFANKREIEGMKVLAV